MIIGHQKQGEPPESRLLSGGSPLLGLLTALLAPVQPSTYVVAQDAGYDGDKKIQRDDHILVTSFLLPGGQQAYYTRIRQPRQGAENMFSSLPKYGLQNRVAVLQ